MSKEWTHDVVAFGATGFTGRLVCERLRDRDHRRRVHHACRGDGRRAHRPARDHAGVRIDVQEDA